MKQKKVEEPKEVLVEKIEVPEKPGVQVFKMLRQADSSGVSGIGLVGWGTIMPNGWCFFTWNSATAGFEWFPTFEAFKFVHVDAHPTNGTILTFLEVIDEKP